MRLGWLLVPLLLVLVGVVLFAAREPVPGSAFTLRVGDCFDAPASDAIGEVTPHPCDGPHDGEVFLAQDYTGATDYPGTGAIGTWVDDACVAGAFRPYVGDAYASRPDLAVAYFFPQVDAWARGERRVTCYLAPADGGKATASFRGSDASGASAAAPSSAAP